MGEDRPHSLRPPGVLFEDAYDSSASSGWPAWKSWLAALGVATLLSVVFATQLFMDAIYREQPLGQVEALRLAMSDWYAWALLFPVILGFTRRFPFTSTTWARALVAHLPASLTLTGLKLAGEAVAVLALTGAGPPQNMFKLYFNLLIYWMLVATAHGIAYYRQYRAQERTALQLEARLAEARLDALKGQLNPHFLFNTLNGISSLMRTDLEAADLMMERLATLLRTTLDNPGQQEVPLREEIEVLETYLQIEATRLEERLRVSWAIDDDALGVLVPSSLLQPLAENAIRYGIAPRRTGGTLSIAARRRDGRLELEVHDDGPGFATLPPTEGIGLSSTRRRLEQLYGAGRAFELMRGHDGGATVRISIPAREAPPEATIERLEGASA